MERKIDLNALRTFVTTVELGGLAKAGRYLGMPKSTVSRHVAKLEEQLGLKLLFRDQHGIEITSAGHRLFESSRAGLDSFRSVRRIVAQSEGSSRGLVRVKTPRTFGRGFLCEVASRFCVMHPEVNLQINLTERLFNPDEDDIDVAFCVGTIIPGSLEFWHLGDLQAKLYASPEFVDRNPINTPGDLKEAPLMTRPCGSALKDRWTLKTLSGKEHFLSFVPRLEANETDVLVEAARRGIGVARLPSFIAIPLCETGELVPVLPDWYLDRFDVCIAARKKMRTHAVDTFIDFCRQELRVQIDGR
jgi:DNA-binding transcriptional LysR family regulator